MITFLIIYRTVTEIVKNYTWAHLHYIDDTYKLGWADGWVESLGYAGHTVRNLSAGSAYNYWMSDSIFVFAGHGNAGRIRFESPEGFTRIFGTGGTNISTSLYISKFGAYDITDNLLAMFIACYTANTDATNGNLLDWARTRGADIAIGWQDEQRVDAEAVFGLGFFRMAYVNNYPVDDPVGHTGGGDNDLMQQAYRYMLNNTTYADTRMALWTTKGQSSKRIRPASYGTP